MKLALVPALFVVGAALGLAAPIDLKGKSAKQTFDELLPGMGAKDLAARKEPQQKWQDICFQASAPGNEALRAEACKLMVGKLDSQTPTPARVWLLEQLRLIGRAESVDAVAALLDDKDDLVRDATVRCLANMPVPEATARLAARLPGATGKAKVGLLNALGHRADRAAGDAIAKELADKEAAVAVAAARALARIDTPEAARALAGARGKAQGEVRLAISDAYLRHADRLLKDGKTGEAAAIYKELNRPEEPRGVRLAALQGVLRSAGDGAGPLFLDIFAGADVDARAIAVAQIETLSAGALKSLAGDMEKLPAASQVLVLNGLAARGEKSQMPVALAAAKSPNEAVRTAAVRALGRLGDASVVPLLIETMFGASGPGSAAADSLAQVAGDGVNEKVLAALEAEKAPARIAALIGLLERRKAVTAVPALLNAARSGDAGVRTAAFTALRNLAEPKHVPAMVTALMKMEPGKDREQAEQAIVAVCSQIGEPAKRAEPILAALQVEAKEHRTALLPLVGRLGGPEALRLVKEALASSSPELHAAGVAAICNWPDASASEVLLKLAQEAKEADHRLRALQAVIRVNAVLSDAPTEPRLAALKKAMELASRDQERRAILDGIGFVRHLDTLRYVVPYLDDKGLNQSACRAVVELAHSRNLREPNQAEFNKALDRVLAICKDKGLIERARQYREGR